MNKLYQDNQDMIRDMAWKVARSTGLEFEDLESEGNFIFAKCAEKWMNQNVHTAKFSTYLYKTLTMDLYRYARKQCNYLNNVVELQETSETDSIERDTISKITLENLSRDARMCIELVFDPPKEMLDMKKNFKKQKDTVNKYLIKNYLTQKGWKEFQIDRAFSEIRTAIM